MRPVIVGAGSPSTPHDGFVDLSLPEERRFAGGVVYLRYAVGDVRLRWAGDSVGGMPEEILSIVLDKPTRAEEVLLSLAHLQSEGRIKMHDAVVVAKDAEGRRHIVETVDVTPAKGAMAGSWWGLLAGLLIGGPIGLAGVVGGAAAGALYGKLVDRGLEDDWVKSMADWILPDSSALLLLVDTGFSTDVIDELRRFEGAGHVAYTTLPEGTKAEIESALAGETE